MEANEIGNGKRGMLTIAVMLLGSALVMLVLAVSAYSTSLSAANRELASAENAAAQVDSASYGIQSILSHEGVNVSYPDGGGRSNISFKMDVQRLRNYAADADRFARFAESWPGAGMAINRSEAKFPKFYLQPQGIVADFGGATEALFKPGADGQSPGSILGYEVLAVLERPAPDLNWTAKAEVPPESPDGIYLHVGVQGWDGVRSYSGNLNRSAASVLRLQDGAGFPLMEIRAEAPSSLRVYYDSELNGTIETKVMLNGSAVAVLGTSLINVNGAVRSSGPVIMDEN
jgi:hypothetical protein